MDGKVVFVNKSSRLVAAQVGDNAYIVFEYAAKDNFEVKDRLQNLGNKVGRVVITRSYVRESDSQTTSNKPTVNILSTTMDFMKAKLVVAPWQDITENEEIWQTA